VTFTIPFKYVRLAGKEFPKERAAYQERFSHRKNNVEAARISRSTESIDGRPSVIQRMKE